jgi:hypothetical protein
MSNPNMHMAWFSHKHTDKHSVLRDFPRFEFRLAHIGIVACCSVGTSGGAGIKSIPVDDLVCVRNGILWRVRGHGVRMRHSLSQHRVSSTISVDVMRQECAPRVMRAPFYITGRSVRNPGIIDWTDIVRLAVVVPGENLRDC